MCVQTSVIVHVCIRPYPEVDEAFCSFYDLNNIHNIQPNQHLNHTQHKQTFASSYRVLSLPNFSTTTPSTSSDYLENNGCKHRTVGIFTATTFLYLENNSFPPNNLYYAKNNLYYDTITGTKKAVRRSGTCCTAQ